MMLQFFLAQVVTPSASPTVSASPSAETGLELATKGIQMFGNLRSTDAIPAAMERLWSVTMNGNLYRMISGFGLMIAILAIGFWCVKFYKTLEEGGIRPAVNDLVIPLIVVMLLSNGGDKLREMTIHSRIVMNSVNRTVTRTISAEIDLKTAIGTLAASNLVKDMVEQGLNNCKSEIEPMKLQYCIERNVVGFEFIKSLFTKLRAENTANGTQASKDDFALWETALMQYRRERVKATNAAALANAATAKPTVTGASGTTSSSITTTSTTNTTAAKTSNNASIDLRSITGYSSSQEVRAVILSMRGAFIYIIEVVMLVTALVGPIFVALSLFPSGSKFLLNWGASFFSLGFCKICYSLISGLAGLAMVYVGPYDSDMLVTSLVLGLLAPVLSFGIASGSGIGILSTISYAGQSYGVNIGMNGYPKNTSVSNGSLNIIQSDSQGKIK